VPELALADALAISVADVLEKMFFVRSLGEGEESAGEPEIVARLTFEGSPPGSLTLRVTARAARSIAADFLGADEPDLAAREVEEVICELANMICGSVLSRVESDSIFRLDTPKIIPAEEDRPEGTEARSTASQTLEISRGVLVATIQMEGTAWPKVAEPVC
jgi:CheY-specific phosphatase CheX